MMNATHGQWSASWVQSKRLVGCRHTSACDSHVQVGEVGAAFRRQDALGQVRVPRLEGDD
eukprot:6193129-Pleurochrysis_carterae.AAC.2